MTSRICKECGYKQEIRTDKRKQDSKFRCYKCGVWNKMRLAAMMLVITLAVGTTSAYAEEYTFDIPFDIKSVQCTEVTDELIVTCTFLGTQPFKVTVENKTLTPEPVEENGESLEVELEEELKLTREERAIKRTIDRIEQDLIDDRDSVPNADKQLLILLKRVQEECYFGIEQGAPIQDYALHGYPTGNLYLDDTDFSKYTQLGKIAQLIEACKGWDKYRFSHLGQQYADIAEANAAIFGIDIQRNLDRQAFVDAALVNITNTNEYMNRVISEHDILEEEEDAADFMCSVEGKQRGFCPSGIGEDVYEYDAANHPILSKYLQYKTSPESAVGEPKYDIKTDSKCYTLASFAKQHELDEESRRALMIAGGCTV